MKKAQLRDGIALRAEAEDTLLRSPEGLDCPPLSLTHPSWCLTFLQPFITVFLPRLC